MNIVTACCRCNTRKSSHLLEEIGWVLQPIRSDAAWDGLVGCYSAICDAAGCSDRAYHRTLLAALGQPAVAPTARAKGNPQTGSPAALTKTVTLETDCTLRDATTAAREADRLLARWADTHGWHVKSERSRTFFPPRKPEVGLRLAAEFRAHNPSVELDLDALRRQGENQAADEIHAALTRLAGQRVATKFPRLACSVVVSEWEIVVRDVLEPYRVARG
jgi:hypothetical protein